MSGRFKRSWCEAGAQTPPLLRASSPLKPKNQPRTNIENWYSERGHFTTACIARDTLEKVHRKRPRRQIACQPSLCIRYQMHALQLLDIFDRNRVRPGSLIDFPCDSNVLA
jgi:hypothetical protein